MHVSGKWLGELVDLPRDTTPAQIAERLTSAGLEVEGVDELARGLAGVVVARVTSCVPHENADKLRVCTVDAGSATADGPVVVVCGAPNVYEGAVVCFATPGTVLPDGKKIATAAVRGITSHGMLCSATELGLPADVDGLLLLNENDPGVVPGAAVAAIVGRDDVIYTLGVTPNRPDALSHLGVARELAATFKTRLKANTPTCAERGGPVDGLATVDIDDTDGCPRYACRVIEDAVVQPSPRWLQARLAALGMRSINTIVDVTNLVMLERGIPLHAFDYDKITKSGSRAAVHVRSARNDEKIVTLDGKERALVAGDVVIADGPVDGGRAIAIAGVMGGKDTEVTATTTRVLLEGAFFNGSRVRKTARRLDLHSEASHRFERGTDPNGVQQSLDRAASLIAELSLVAGQKETKARVARGTLDSYPKKVAPVVVTFRPRRAAQILGVPPKLVDEASSTKMLQALGLEVDGRGEDAIRFRVPTYRPDLTREIDLIEELLRLLGMDQIPSTLPAHAGEATTALFDARRHRTLQACKRALLAAGYDEAVNLAFAAPDDVSAIVPWDYEGTADDVLRLKNPLGEERSSLRRSLLPALAQNVALNHRRGTSDVRLFEAATVFLGRNPNGTKPRPSDDGAPAGGDAFLIERPRLAAIASGAATVASFDQKSRALDVFDVKGHLEELFDILGVRARFEAGSDGLSGLHPRSSTWVSVLVDGAWVVAGVMGELHPDLLSKWDLGGNAVVFDLDLEVLAQAGAGVVRAQPLPRFPAVRRDFAFVVDETLPAAQLVGTMHACAAAAGVLEGIDIFDVYQGKGVAPGKKSVAVAVTLRASDRTLAEADVQRIADALLADVRTLGAEVRAG
jgi:phenylalanyl-tRNA synthetase beta chain